MLYSDFFFFFEDGFRHALVAFNGNSLQVEIHLYNHFRHLPELVVGKYRYIVVVDIAGGGKFGECLQFFDFRAYAAYCEV